MTVTRLCSTVVKRPLSESMKITDGNSDGTAGDNYAVVCVMKQEHGCQYTSFARAPGEFVDLGTDTNVVCQFNLTLTAPCSQ